MKHKRRVICTVTNDLTYDQRMHRICNTLAQNGFDVLLVGRRLPNSIPLRETVYRTQRLPCRFRKGFAFYAEFNLRLFVFLLGRRFDLIGTVDSDTLPAGALAGLLKGATGVFDAHEYFTEVPEVTHRPFVKMFWRGVERLFLPFYQKAYTVGPALAQLLSELHGMPFGVVRNVPMPLAPLGKKPENGKKILLYQGALNEGRGIEALIGAMGFLPDRFELHLAGEGDLSQTLRQLAAPLGEKVRFWGFIQPDALRQQTHTAWLGLNLLENKGKSYYYSLANKYFDYVQARVPVMTMAFPEYLALQARHRVALLLERLEPREIAQHIMDLEQNPEQYAAMVQACEAAACEWHWGKEAELLLNIWQK